MLGVHRNTSVRAPDLLVYIHGLLSGAYQLLAPGKQGGKEQAQKEQLSKREAASRSRPQADVTFKVQSVPSKKYVFLCFFFFTFTQIHPNSPELHSNPLAGQR